MVNRSEEPKRGFIDRTGCMGPRNDKELGGPRCQEPATHSTYIGRRCTHHAEGMRQALLNPNALVSVLKGRAHTEEEIARLVKELSKGEQPS